MKGLVAVLASVLVGSFAFVFHEHPPTNSGEWAGWVQAAGSIFAIFASVGIVGWQAHADRARAREADNQESRAHLEVAAELVDGARQVAQKMAAANFAQAPHTFNAMRSDVGPLADAIGALDHTRLGRHSATRPTLVALGATRQMLANIEDARISALDGAATFVVLRNRMAQMQKILEECLKELRAALTKATTTDH